MKIRWTWFTIFIGLSIGIGMHFIIAMPASAQDRDYKGAEVYGLPDYFVQYGKMEVRMMAASGSGVLSTFFMWKEGSEQSDVFWEEIDIEIFGKDNATSWQTNLISGLNSVSHSEQVHTHSASLAENFHTYAIEWTPEYIAWFFEGEEVRRVTDHEINNPAGLRFNIWSHTQASWVGPWNDEILPVYQFVNWVKYYRYEDGEFIPEWEDEFEEFDNNRWARANWTFDQNRVVFDPENAIVQDGMLILALTHFDEPGFTGTVPQDQENQTVTVANDYEERPGEVLLGQNYPNPFNPVTVINYQLPVSGEVRLEVFDLLGRHMATLENGYMKAGWYTVTFDASQLASGMYLYRLETGHSVITRNMMLIK